MLYELTTGRPPFQGESAMAIAYKHVQENPVPPRQLDPELPETLEAITLKCLAKNPDNRYPTAADLRADLRRYLDGADPGRAGVRPADAGRRHRRDGADGLRRGGARCRPTRATDDDGYDDYYDEPGGEQAGQGLPRR